jgi:hypothetical protein
MVKTRIRDLDDSPAEVEIRLQRLESAVTALQDTPLMEERVVERVIERLKKTPIKNHKETSATDSSESNVDADAKAETPSVVVSSNTDRSGWFLFDLISEFRSMFKMTTDHRYQFSLIGRIGPITIVVIYIMLWLLIGSGGILGIFERIFDIALIMLLFHILSREARLYRSRFG